VAPLITNDDDTRELRGYDHGADWPIDVTHVTTGRSHRAVTTVTVSSSVRACVVIRRPKPAKPNVQRRSGRRVLEVDKSDEGVSSSSTEVSGSHSTTTSSGPSERETSRLDEKEEEEEEQKTETGVETDDR